MIIFDRSNYPQFTTPVSPLPAPIKNLSDNTINQSIKLENEIKQSIHHLERYLAYSVRGLISPNDLVHELEKHALQANKRYQNILK